jgi:type IV pilus assembly protein PilB
MAKRNFLGEKMVNMGLISSAQLELALKEQKNSGKPISEVFVNLGLATPEAVLSIMASDAGVRFIKLDGLTEIEPEALELVSESGARTYRLMPVSVNNHTLTVATAGKMDMKVIDELQRRTGCYVEVVFATEEDILQTIDQFYGVKEAVEELIEESIRAAASGGLLKEGDLAADAPIVKLVDGLIVKAVRESASDIHIEPDLQSVRVRYRIDGILHQGPIIPKSLQSAVITRIKIMSNLNISENRLPQDGKSRFFIGEKGIDIRVSTLPTIFGENLVLRLLDKDRLVLGLEYLGFSPENLKKFKDAIVKPNGIILVTGPTGSGKTTTLYSALSYLNTIEKNIITLEDPIEYELPMIRQSQVNPKIGWNFVDGLRTILRQDPDIIFVGEIRDEETMEMAIRAALTGHLVFSTLHTNDAVGAISRLLNLGAEPSLLASCIVAIIAQRLVRVICKHCKGETVLDAEYLKWVGLLEEEAKFYVGTGCRRCNNTGYRGQIGIFEIFTMTPEIRDLCIQNPDIDEIKKAAIKAGMTTMLEDGLEKAKAGITTVEEVIRKAYQ